MRLDTNHDRHEGQRIGAAVPAQGAAAETAHQRGDRSAWQPHDPRSDHLTKRYKKASVTCGRRHQLRRHARRAVRLPRAERRGQDHDDLDPDHDPVQDGRHGHHRRPRPRSRGDRGPPQHRDHLPEPEHRPAPVGRGEHPAPRRDLRDLRLPAVLPADAGRLPRARRAPGRRSSVSGTTCTSRSRRSRAG